MNVPLRDEMLLILGASSFLLIAKVTDPFALCIETFDGEVTQTLEAEDIIAVSAPEGGSLEQAGMLLELVRTYHAPLVVLPSNHPGSRRLRMVVSAGREILLSCEIQRGTHPQQHLICSSPELAGIRVSGVLGGVEVESLPPDIALQYIPSGRAVLRNNNN